MIADFDQAMQSTAGARLMQTPLGRTLGYVPQRSHYRHDWKVTAQWSARAGVWVLQSAPGYVNGRAPIYRTSAPDLAQLEPGFGINLLTGQPLFSDPIFSRNKPAAQEGGEAVEIPLYLNPAIPVKEWRDEGASAPEFFRQKGVLDPKATVIDRSKPERQLRAVDLILHQPRVALVSHTQFHPGILDGTTFVQQTLTTRFPAADDVLRVYAGDFQLPQPPDPLAGDFEEPAYDELQIARIYLLSAPGAKESAPLDGSWVPYVGQELFWNLSWIPAPLFQAPPDLGNTPNPLAGLGLLGAGTLAAFSNTFAAAANDAEQAALNLLAARSQAGTWWTPTGGGTRYVAAATPPVPALSSDKTARAAAMVAREKAIAAAARAAAGAGLNPPFPYRGISFEPARMIPFLS